MCIASQGRLTDKQATEKGVRRVDYLKQKQEFLFEFFSQSLLVEISKRQELLKMISIKI